MKLRLATPLTVSGRVIVETIEGAPTPSAPSVLLIKQHGGQILYSEQAIFTMRTPGLLMARIFPKLVAQF